MKEHHKRVKTPTVLQMENLECGAAALCIILRYHKRYVPLEDVRVQCGVSRGGANAYNILQAAKFYGLESDRYRCTADDLRELPMPMIIHWRNNHFLVLEGITKKCVYINDPAMGPTTYTFEEFENYFSDYAFYFKKTPSFKPGGKPPSVLRLMHGYASGNMTPLIYLFLCGIGLSLIGGITPIFSRMFIDQVLIAKLNTVFVPLILALIISTLIQIGFTILNGYYKERYKHKLTVFYTSEFLWLTFGLPLRFFSQRMPADISSRVNLNGHIANVIASVYVDIAINVIMIATFISLMFYLDTELTIFSLIAIVLNLILIKVTKRLREDSSQRSMTGNMNLAGSSYMGLQQIESVKAQGREQELYADLMSKTIIVSNIQQQLVSKTAIYDAIPGFLSNIITTIILCYGCYKVMISELTIGSLFAYQFFYANINSPLSALLSIPGKLQQMMGSFVKLKDVLDYPNHFKVDILDYSPEDIKKALSIKHHGRIKISNLFFRYGPRDDMLIKDFNLEIEPGEQVAIVGSSGSGKSTLARVLNNLYQPHMGTVMLDGIDIQEINRLVYVNSVSMVSQEIMIFNGSFKDNITLWDYTISLEDVIKAAKDACLHEFITTNHRGYNDILKEKGKNLSGGQKQKIEIARALVSNPSVLIMDEATSALDSITESKILNNIKHRGCTTIIIAHRLSTIRDANKIVVLEKGVIVDVGTHESLMAKRGVYYDMIKADLGS